MLDYETRYVMIERYYLALVWATRRLRHYMIEYSVHLISRLDLLRYLLNKPVLVGRLMRWLVLLTEFDIHYVTQKSIKGSIVANHLASLPVSNGTTIEDDFPDEDVVVVTSLSSWRMYFNGVANYSRYGIACILGLETDLGLRIRQMESAKPIVDTLVTLASMIDIPADTVVHSLLIESRSVLAYCCLIDETELDDDRAFVDRVMREVHAGVCGPHMGGHMLARTTPYSLVYGIEVVLPVDIEMGSLKVALKQQILEADWAQAQLDQLNLLDEED
ncbi:hypothetical protein CK203_082904 [Vitis vinifera]|uniref:Reverse transcriptase RNase H-like domain-containing protein n=1 Tax=Vitis vinifera TaxID=29760 RepID=A0A438D6Y2_VITVI|nr:hypothetical protein CK203_082904 [Vitis vinifera]